MWEPSGHKPSWEKTRTTLDRERAWEYLPWQWVPPTFLLCQAAQHGMEACSGQKLPPTSLPSETQLRRTAVLLLGSSSWMSLVPVFTSRSLNFSLSSNPGPAAVLVTQSCPTLCYPTNCSAPGSSVRGILQAGILEWVAMPSSRGSSQLRDQTQVSHMGRWILYHWTTWEALRVLNYSV